MASPGGSQPQRLPTQPKESSKAAQQPAQAPQQRQKIEANKETRDKAEQAKAYIEQKYMKMKEEETVKKEAWDKLLRQMDKMQLSATEKELIKQEIQHKDAELSRMARTKLKPSDFLPKTIIGRGAFGEVRVCRTKKDNSVVAIKKMKQTEMVKKNQVAHVKAERDIMAEARNEWIVDLKCSFRDEKFLYLVMEFLPGGDLMTLLMRKDILSEEESRFYISETIMAVKSVHDLNYIHRDLKPDNLLIGSDGHVKLSDFGLCKHVEIKPKNTTKQTEGTRKDLEEAARQAEKGLGSAASQMSKVLYNKRSEYKRRQLAYSTVGTPDYIAPEVFGQSGYNETVDWWSVGAILFEMLVGYPPFFSDDPSVTCQKILHWRKTLQIPQEANLSPAATDLLKRLMCDADHRLGSNGIEEIQNHPFFEGVDWNKLRNQKVPWVPDLKSEEDCKNFDHFDEEEPFIPLEDRKTRKTKKDIQFIGYTFNKHVEEQKANFVKALNESLQPDANADEDHSPGLGAQQRQMDMHQMGQGGYMADNMMQQQKIKQNTSQQQQQQQQVQQQQVQKQMMQQQQQVKTSQTSSKPTSSKAQAGVKDFGDLTNQPSKQMQNKGMAQTAYDNGFGMAAQNNQFYGQAAPQQKQMAQSSYGKGFTGSQPQKASDMKSYQQKMPGSGASRQPHPDISIKKSGSSNTSSSNQGYANNQQMYNMNQLTNEQKILFMQMQKKGVPQSSTGAAKKTTTGGIQLGAAKKSSSGLGGKY